MKNIFDIQRMLKTAKEMQENIDREMTALTVEGSSGGGMVKVAVDGKKNVKSISLEPEIVDKNEINMLQDMIIAALNDAFKKADEILKEKLNQLSGGLNMPGLF